MQNTQSGVAGAGLGGAHTELDAGIAGLFSDLDHTELGGPGSRIVEQSDWMVAPFGVVEEVGLKAGGGEVEGEMNLGSCEVLSG